MSEKRKYHRLETGIPLSYRIPPSKKYISTTAEDIGGTGVSFSTGQPIKEKQEILMYMSLPNRAQKAEVHGKVVHVKEKKGISQVGIQIQDPIKFDERDYIRFYATKLNESYRKL